LAPNSLLAGLRLPQHEREMQADLQSEPLQDQVGSARVIARAMTAE